MAYSDDDAIALYLERKRLTETYSEDIDNLRNSINPLRMLTSAVEDAESCPPGYRTTFMMRQAHMLASQVGRPAARLIIAALRDKSDSLFKLSFREREIEERSRPVSEGYKVRKRHKKEARLAIDVALEWKTGKHRTLPDAAEAAGVRRNLSGGTMLNFYWAHKSRVIKSGEPFDAYGIERYGKPRVRIDELPGKGRIPSSRNSHK